MPRVEHVLGVFFESTNESTNITRRPELSALHIIYCINMFHDVRDVFCKSTIPSYLVDTQAFETNITMLFNEFG